MEPPRDPALVERDRQRGIAEDKALPDGAFSLRATLDRPGVNVALGTDWATAQRVRLRPRAVRDLASDLLFMAQLGCEDHGEPEEARRFRDARRVLQELLPRERLERFK